MGQKQPSLFDIVFDLKFKAKHLNKVADKMERDIKKEKLKVKKFIEKGDMQTAKIFAQNAIRKKNERTNMYRLAARIEASASQIESAGRTQAVGKMMGRVVKGLDMSMEKMNVDHLTLVMDKFETRMEDMNVISEYQNTALQSSSAHLEQPQEVESLLKEVAQEHQLNIENQLVDVGGTSSIGTPQQAQTVKKEDDLEARLAKLQL